jgi:hypothetical protein
MKIKRVLLSSFALAAVVAAAASPAASHNSCLTGEKMTDGALCVGSSTGKPKNATETRSARWSWSSTDNPRAHKEFSWGHDFSDGTRAWYHRSANSSFRLFTPSLRLGDSPRIPINSNR